MAFDTLQFAISREADVVIIDTAGRLHTKFSLMEELARQGREKSQRVLLVVDATTGQNGLIQVKVFTEAVKWRRRGAGHRRHAKASGAVHHLFAEEDAESDP